MKKIEKEIFEEHNGKNAWKTANLREWTIKDLEAAIALLTIILKEPGILDGIVKVLEDKRADFIKREVELGEKSNGKPVGLDA